MNLTITERAKERILSTVASDALDDSWLRVAVVPGGCSGLAYELGWDTTVGEKDKTVTLEGIPVVVDQRSAPFLDDCELDFTDGLDGRGFHFNNPHAARECACGESFGM